MIFHFFLFVTYEYLSTRIILSSCFVRDSLAEINNSIPAEDGSPGCFRIIIARQWDYRDASQYNLLEIPISI